MAVSLAEGILAMSICLSVCLPGCLAVCLCHCLCLCLSLEDFQFTLFFRWIENNHHLLWKGATKTSYESIAINVNVSWNQDPQALGR